FFQAEDGIRDFHVTGVQTCALPIFAAMNRRARLQLQLQQTVEGLSVAAITYYAAGIAGYLFKAMKSLGWRVDPELATGLSVVPRSEERRVGAEWTGRGARPDSDTQA